MQFKALLLTPQRRPSHVVNSTLTAFAGVLPVTVRAGRLLIYYHKSHPGIAYRPIASNATSAPNKILKGIKEHTRTHPVTILHSRSDNPYHNLAIENYILKNSDPQSKILLFYTNRPCVVFGRNQNPWLECNITRIQDGISDVDWNVDTVGSGQHATTQIPTHPPIPLDLVRRRSGGGTVIHDVGNLNFSFIVPNDKDFNRDKHGELVSRSLQMLKTKSKFAEHVLYESVRINERHDIVMMRKGDETRKEFKVSGSAFKLTRGRALHHGTILHSSPNVHRQMPVFQDEGGTVAMGVFSALLSSPAKPFLEAKGVGSVRSPVHNLFGIQTHEQRHELMKTLREEIGELFLQAYDILDIPAEEVGDEDCSAQVNEDVYKDVQEMMTDNWRYCQTPTFEYRSGKLAGDLSMQFQVKHGIIKNAVLCSRNGSSEECGWEFSRLEEKKIHEIQSWNEYLPASQSVQSDEALAHLKTVFPKITLASTNYSPNSDNVVIKEAHVQDTDTGNVTARELRSGYVEVEKKGENIITEYQKPSHH